MTGGAAVTGAGRCLVVPKPRPAARQRLVVFPHAGGGASFYRAWAELLGPDIELRIVEYPGHETRMAEPLTDDLDLVVEEVVAELDRTGDGRPETALFGHSMGAIVAHETAVRLGSAGRLRVTDLFVSASTGRPPTGRYESIA